MKFRYTEKHLVFLREGYKKMQIPELRCAFNKKFKLSKTEIQIKSTLKNHGFTCGRKTGFPKGTYRLLNKKQVDFLIKKYTKFSRVELTAALNKKFNTAFTVSQVVCFLKNHNISSGRTGMFDKGHKPWNMGTKGIMKPNSGNFNKGNIPANIKPLGHERICSKDGYILVKVAETNPYNEQPTRYKAKHIVIWEEAHGKPPPGMIVSFIDGNKLNCVLENLMLISRAEALYLNQNGYKDLPADLKPNMLALAKLECKNFALMKRSVNQPKSIKEKTTV